tara:strand:- start:12 stop:194 length:183 start_codon:yes stop_codon:yes gene_type:complete
LSCDGSKKIVIQEVRTIKVNVRIIKMGMKENSDLLRTYLVNKLIVLHQEKLKFEERHGEV